MKKNSCIVKVSSGRVYYDKMLKRPIVPPKGKGNEIWKRLYTQATTQGMPNPEKYADAVLRCRERAEEIKAARPTIKMCTKVPTKIEENSNPKKGGRTLPSAECRCRATLLNGKKCEFKATQGDFCNKHALKTNKNL